VPAAISINRPFHLQVHRTSAPAPPTSDDGYQFVDRAVATSGPALPSQLAREPRGAIIEKRGPPNAYLVAFARPDKLPRCSQQCASRICVRARRRRRPAPARAPAADRRVCGGRTPG
jgi:hypothetical protein